MCELQYAARVIALRNLGVRVQALNRSSEIIRASVRDCQHYLYFMVPDPNNCYRQLRMFSLHLQGEAAIYCEDLSGGVIIRFQKEKDRQCDVFGVTEAGNDLLLDKRVVFAAFDAFLRHSGIIDARSNDIDPDLPLFRKDTGSVDQRSLWRSVDCAAGKYADSLHRGNENDCRVLIACG